MSICTMEAASTAVLYSIAFAMGVAPVRSGIKRCSGGTLSASSRTKLTSLASRKREMRARLMSFWGEGNIGREGE